MMTEANVIMYFIGILSVLSLTSLVLSLTCKRYLRLFVTDPDTNMSDFIWVHGLFMIPVANFILAGIVLGFAIFMLVILAFDVVANFIEKRLKRNLEED